MKWNRTINLVSPKAMDAFWARHALDSWQLASHIPAGTRTAIDLGSGAGFPGLAIAIAFKDRGAGQAGGHVTLVESAGKKANFLRAAARELDLPVTVSSERAESLPHQPFDLVTARAFAPLPRLLGYAAPFWGPGTTGLFLKGEGVETEIAEASRDWRFSTTQIPSRSSETGKLLHITDLAPKGAG